LSKGVFVIEHINQHSYIEKRSTAEEIDRLFYYDGHDLGNRYHEQATVFRLWAPLATEAKVIVYEKWDDGGKEIIMERTEKGTWAAKLDGDQDGLVYTYKVKSNEQWNEVVDPYARAVTINGDKGVVINLMSTNPDNWSTEKPEQSSVMDTIIYELHIRDASIHPASGIVHKGKYLGLAETGTTGPEGMITGLDHIKSLGVTHVQLLPMFDYATVDEASLDRPQYNWGYDPKHFNAPEGSYATDPYDPKTRIKEMKQMIQSFHDQGLRVIMDVVYNHVYSVEDSPFNKLMPGYYFRYLNGQLVNGTGVGNDTASERLMMRKFIIDSVSYWASEYHLDGFRFDLMGIHDVQTMNQVRQALDDIDPSIIVLGEGWDLNTTLPADQKANQKNASMMPRIAQFNDFYRDSLKGSSLESIQKGFISNYPGLEENMKKGICAGGYDQSTASFTSPNQVVVYAEAHDNHTLWDKLFITNKDSPPQDRKRMHRLASAIILTSQGIPFLHAGQEFMRTKRGDENSYKSPDIINQLDWTRCSEYAEEIEYMKGLIKLRKTYPSFRMDSYPLIHQNLNWIETPANVVAYRLSGKPHELIVIHNSNHHEIEVTLPYRGDWSILVNGEQAGIAAIAQCKGSSVKVSNISTLILKKNE